MKIFGVFFCLLGMLTGSSISQMGTKAVPGRMAIPPLPTGGPETGEEKKESAGSEMVSPDTIQFPNNPVSDFLLIYEKLKGVTLIKDASLLAGGANLSLTLNQPVTKAEAIRLLESTLLLNGYAFIAVDEKAIKVINTLGGKNPRSEGVFLFEDENKLPEGEVIASYVMPLQNLTAADAVPIFEQFITLHPYGSLVPAPVANKVLITENSTLIRRLIEVKKLVDKPAPVMDKKFVQLHQADADRVVELINKLFEDRKSSSGSGGTAKAATGQPSPPPGVPSLPGAAGSAGGVTISGGEIGSDILLIPDTRTNRILISARPEAVEYIEKLIADFDIAVDLSDPYEYPLNYVAASDMLPILNDLLQEQTDQGTGGTGGAASQPARTVSGGIGSNLANAANSARTGGSSGGVSGAGQLGSLQEPGEQQAAQSLIVGKTRLIADNRANSILVIGQPEAKQKVQSILEKLDKRPLQVYLATVIGQLRVSNADDFSVNILQKYAGGSTGAASISGGRNFTSTNTPLSGTAANMAAMANVAQAALGGLPGVQIMTFIGNSLNLYIQALTATARFRIASRPAIFTANNKKAVIFNGQKIAVPTSTVTTLGAGGSATTTSGSQQSNIQYQDVVLKIEVVPLINSAREISLQIIQTNDTLEKGINSTTDIGGGVQVPKINTQELTTSVIVPDRATILLGGLVTQTDEKASTGVPFLSTIPLMGNLFKSTSDTTDRQELVVMMQPSVIGDTPELKEISRTERDLTGFSSKELAPVSKNMGGKLSPGASPSPTLDADPQSNKRSWDTLWSKNSQE